MSARAKIQAEEIALMPNLRQQVSRHDPQAIQAFMQQIAAHSDASFIVIGDRQEFICFIPSIRVGRHPTGRRRQPCGTGRKSITTIRKGGLGVSLRSKTPILDDAGRVIGIVSVGYLTSYLDSITLTKVINILSPPSCCSSPCLSSPGTLPAASRSRFFARAAGNWPAGSPAKAMMESIFEG
nr:Sensor histidine kinase CitA [Klebsiella pneumoniae]